MGDGKFFGGVVLASTIIGASIVGSALINRGGQENARYAMLKSGFTNTVWRLDQATGSMSYCGNYSKTGLKCEYVSEPVYPVGDVTVEEAPPFDPTQPSTDATPKD